MEIRKEDAFTWANLTSNVGLALQIDGSRRLDTVAGIAEVAVGGTCDLLDGKIARWLGESSDLGSIVDATYDKISGASIIYQEWKKGIAPKVVLGAIVGHNVVNTVATALATKNHPNESLRPSDDGKQSMFFEKTALGAYAISHVLRKKHPVAANRVRYAAHASAIAGVGYFGIKATKYYFDRAK